MENWGRFFSLQQQTRTSISINNNVYKPQRSFGGLQKLPTSRNNNNTNEDKDKNYNFKYLLLCY